VLEATARREMKMRKCAFVVGLVFLLGVPVMMAQQETPRAEVSGAYSYARVDSPDGVFNAHGASGSVAVNVSRWFGVAGDLGVYKLSDQPPGEGVTLVSFLFGPRISFRGDEHVTPFIQLLMGGAHLSQTDSSQTGFAMAAGGGLDVKVTQHLAIRLVQAEYVMTRLRFESVNQTQHNARISGGIVFRLGEKK
jgi:opacity protein-like surface antigen